MSQLGKTHLEFYKQHQIAPVRYDLKDMEMHLERRASLYLKLGMPPLVFRSAKVLEVAAGTGHNSLYLASLKPSKLVLLEPNPVGLDHIRAVYQTFEKSCTLPEVVTCMLEDYSPIETFDVVLCENWLGTSDHEISLLHKLSQLVAYQGLLVLTTVSPIGFVPNLLRRFISAYIAPIEEGFEERTRILVNFFSSHLDTLKSMTRSKVDWVHDNMLNPAYFGLALSIPKVVEQIGDRFELIGSSPSFAEDWRWFKSICGKNRQNNQFFLGEYWSKAHNFLDHKESTTVRNTGLNCQMEQISLELLKTIELHEEAHLQKSEVSYYKNLVREKLAGFLSLIPENFIESTKALREIYELMPALEVGKLLKPVNHFKSLFGRETAYVSLLQKEPL